MITNHKETNDLRETKNKNTVVSAHLRVRQSKTYRAKTDDLMFHSAAGATSDGRAALFCLSPEHVEQITLVFSLSGTETKRTR